MKRNFFSLLLFVAAGVAFTSCDDNIAGETAIKSTQTNYFALSGSTQDTPTGILQYNTKAEKNTASGESYYRHEIGLLTSDFEIGYDETEGLIIGGNGSSVWLDINSQTSSLEPGTYIFTGVDDSSRAFDFGYGAAEIEGKLYKFTSGKIVVAKTGNNTYTIDFDGDVVAEGTTESKAVKGNFSGMLKTYEDK
jgi:hypothetical protein